MSGTERDEVLRDLDDLRDGLIAERERRCSRPEPCDLCTAARGAIRESFEIIEAEAAALHTEREALAWRLYEAIVSPSDDPATFDVVLDHDTGTAHLARTDTGGQAGG